MITSKKNKEIEKNDVPHETWIELKGQKLDTTDLVWFKKGGFAFVDSNLTTGEPDRFTSIPEAWSFGGSVRVNQRRYDNYGSSHVRENGWVYRDKQWVNKDTPAKWDKITHIMKITNPLNSSN